jgi:hypothetical protein
MKSYLKPNVFAIDIANRVAAIPGAGDVPVTFTYTFDLARSVVAALDLEEWKEESKVVGDVVTWNEFVGLAEEVTGMHCTYHPLSHLCRLLLIAFRLQVRENIRLNRETEALRDY